MFWNEKARRWQMHPECRCNHRIDQACICRGLHMLNEAGEPISYPLLDAIIGASLLPARQQDEAER